MSPITDAEYLAAAKALLCIKPEHTHISDAFVLAMVGEVCDPEFFRAALEVAYRAAQQDATEFTICAHPDRESINYSSFIIRVVDCGRYGWGVTRYSRCLNADGEWVNQPDRDERDEAWFARHRFDLDTALQLARAAAPHVRCNGSTLAEVLDWEREQVAA